MTTLSKRFVRKPLRSPDYDYSSPGMYWVTICVHHMECRFGEVTDGLMHLNDAGLIVDSQWQDIPARYPGTALDAHVVMPNHVHGIVFLGTTVEGTPVSLGTIIGEFKSLVTVEYSRGVHEGRFPRYDRALWQRSFQDRIVQTDRRLDELRQYVEGNPGRWQAKLDTI